LKIMLIWKWKTIHEKLKNWKWRELAYIHEKLKIMLLTRRCFWIENQFFEEKKYQFSYISFVMMWPH
jgi:hypothetical protein